MYIGLSIKENNDHILYLYGYDVKIKNQLNYYARIMQRKDLDKVNLKSNSIFEFD